MGNRGNAGNKIFLVEPGARAAPADDRRARPLQPDLAAGRGRRSRCSPTTATAWRWWRLDPHTGRERLLFHADRVARPAGVQAQVIGPVGGHGDQRRLHGGSRWPTSATACPTCGRPRWWRSGPARPARPAHDRDDRRRVRVVVARRRLARLPVRPRRRHADVRGRRRRHRAGARSSRTTPAPTSSANGSTTTPSSSPASSGPCGTSAACRARPARSPTLTAFTEPRFYVRYPRWDPAGSPRGVRALRDDGAAVVAAAAARHRG